MDNIPTSRYRQAMRILLCLALVFAAGCSSDSPPLLEPEAVAGTYDLVTIDGEPLPVAGTESLYDYEVLSGFLEVRLDGMVEQSITRSERLGAYPAEIRTYESTHPYRLGSRTIVIEYDDAEATGRIRGGELALVRGFGELPRSTWVYVRTP